MFDLDPEGSYKDVFLLVFRSRPNKPVFVQFLDSTFKLFFFLRNAVPVLTPLFLY